MCTASWTVQDRDYRLYFNRDEQKSRERAKAPRVQALNGLEIIAPLDGQGGGSWIAVNERGMTAFLLNNYTAERIECQEVAYRSRGELPILAVSQTEMAKATDILQSHSLSAYRPFYLGLIAPSADCVIFEWNGESLARRSLDIPFLTTSSYRPSEVERYRRDRFIEMCGSKEGDGKSDKAFQFHRDCNHQDSAFNPFMTREDAETHCISVIEVDSNHVRFHYIDRAPGTSELEPAVRCSISRRG